jgi:hypothetical protein
MSRYDGGCFKCGRHKGEFVSQLPNGVCVHVVFAGWYFCNECEEYLKQFRLLFNLVIRRLR